MFKILLVAALVGLVACAKGHDSSALQGSPNAPILAEEDTHTYSIKADSLNLTHTGEPLMSTSASVKGTGKKSSYSFHFPFFSGSANSFKIISLAQKSRYSGCSAPQFQYSLKGDSTRRFDFNSQATVIPQTNYELVVDVAQSCDDLNLSIDVVAWAGQSVEEPQRAISCFGIPVPQVTFFPDVDYGQGFYSLLTKQKFLDHNTFCGEHFEAPKSTIGASFPSNTSIHTECLAEKDQEKRSYTLDLSDTAAKVECKSGSLVTFKEDFNNCSLTIQDYVPYRNFQ